MSRGSWLPERLLIRKVPLCHSGALPSHRSNGLLRHSSAGKAVTASTGNDTVALANLAAQSAASVYGEVGNDVISLGAVGHRCSHSIDFAANKLSGRGANTGAAITLPVICRICTHTTSTTSQLVSILVQLQLPASSLHSKPLVPLTALCSKPTLVTTPSLLVMN